MFFALSRTPHGLLDMAMPAFSALLWLKELPAPSVLMLGLAAVFSGYTAVYALNDLLGCSQDRGQPGQGAADSGGYLDAAMPRHPIARGYLSMRQGIVWAVGWFAVALSAAYLLNPACALIFIAACCLEALYCSLWDVTPLRTLVSGMVKTAGPVAAVFAVDARPDPVYVLHLFLIVFLWEIGGQNIPADWTDMEEDAGLHARTVPVALGPVCAGALAVALLANAAVAGGTLFLHRGGQGAPAAAGLAFAAGFYLLLAPALRLNADRSRSEAVALFNKASYYPLALLCSAIIMLLV